MDRRTPFDALHVASPLGREMGFTPLPFVEGVIIGADMDATGSQPAMTFSVRPSTAARDTGGANSRLEKVILLAPLFGNIFDTSQPPTGLYGLPLVGANVLCCFIGSRWVILGFMTGPNLTAL